MTTCGRRLNRIIRKGSCRAAVLSLLVVTIFGGSIVGPLPASADTSRGWQGRVFSLETEESIRGSHAVVLHYPDRITFSANTSGLETGYAYTVWILAFNQPENCLDQSLADRGFRCGPSDMFNPLAGFSIMYGSGQFAKNESEHFSGERAEGDGSGIILGAGLADAERAEIHLRIRDHGPAQDGLQDEQTGTFGGGCISPPLPGWGTPGLYKCDDVQGTGA